MGCPMYHVFTVAVRFGGLEKFLNTEKTTTKVDIIEVCSWLLIKVYQLRL